MSQIFDFGETAYLEGASAMVIMSENSTITNDSEAKKTISPANLKDKQIDFVSWGEDNKLPSTVLSLSYKNITVASNLDFNSRLAYGDTLMVVKKIRGDNNKIEYQEQLPSEQPEIFKFLNDSNVFRMMQELGNDMAVFYDGMVELILTNEKNSTKIAAISQKEMCFSRLSLQDKDSLKIEYHGYSANWAKSADDIVVTPFLDRSTPLYDLKQRLGLTYTNEGGKKKKKRTTDKRFVMSIGLPTPGRYYYNKPYWWSIFESGWYDFACAIPAFKKALLKNQMVLRYQVLINVAFWDKMYKAEGITEEPKKAARKTAFLTQLNNFLSGEKNAGKSFISHFEYDKVKGFEVNDIVIKPLESFIKGGEYIEDSEEASNALCYAMGVHPSIQGASPGKGKTISGTEARELFIIKQAMTKPIRDALVAPLYIVKELNGWDPDIYFVVPNIVLTTLDKGTGAEKSIGNQKI